MVAEYGKIKWALVRLFRHNRGHFTLATLQDAFDRAHVVVALDLVGIIAMAAKALLLEQWLNADHGQGFRVHLGGVEIVAAEDEGGKCGEDADGQSDHGCGMVGVLHP